ncbi:MAG: FecR domain-containing protein, partial [Myxococcota bacterium]
METREMLERLPDPDPAAMARVWTRFEATRDADGAAQRWGWSWKLPAAGLALTAVAAATLLAVLPERARTVDLTSAGLHQWSEQIRLDLDGRGTATGTDQDLVVDWQSGTIRVEVEPHTGTKLSIVTDEGTIRVVGTVFSVRRDPLGVTTTVERGRVAVTCADGWSGEITVDDAHTCLPTRAAALLGRADALIAADAPTSTVLDA